MKLKYLLAASVVSLSAGVIMPAPVAAQQITSSIQGTVQDGDGNLVSGATVTVTDTRTGASRTTVTGTDGRFVSSNLVVGGPYTISANAAGYEGQSVSEVYTSLQGATDLTFSLLSGSGEIVVTGSRVRVTQLAVGPGTSFGSDVLESAPAFDRDIRDIIRLDPRVSLDRNQESDRVSCLGGNDRTNAFTVDGIPQSDIYGLTDTPFSSRSGAPIPFEAIRETSVEFAPFDVEYGTFTGCAINVVTKSGSNDFSGGAFFEYGDKSLAGDRVANRPGKAAVDDIRYGGSLGGPIIPDRLFFFGAYEHSEVTLAQDDGPTGAGLPNERAFITVEQFNAISDVLQNVYGIDTGDIVTGRPSVSDRYFGRLDLIINDDHRLEATYQRTEENTVRPDDFNATQITGRNTFQNSGSKADYGSVRLYSQWSDVFSTELRYARSEITDTQGPIGGGEAFEENPIPRIIVGVSNGSSQGTFLAGPGGARSANELYTTVDQFKAKGTLNAGAHTFTFGGELNTVNINNLFVFNATNTLYFSGIEALREGLLNGGTSTSTGAANVIAGTTIGVDATSTRDGDINTARAIFSRSTYSVYAQDEWQATDALLITAGVRADWYDGDRPELNPNFVERYGFTNTIGFSSLDPVILPRVALTYDAGDIGFFGRAQLRGGVGIFSGGDPGVWFGNAFQNNGILSATATSAGNCPTGRIDVVTGGTFTGVPACATNAAQTQAQRGLGDTQSIDPDIEVPTVLRANVGFQAELGQSGGGFFSGWNLNLDYIYSKYRKALTVVDLSQTIDIRRGVNGFTIDGNPIFGAIDPTVAGCNATLAQDGVDIRWDGVTAACFNTGRDDELQLTNGRSYESHVASALLSKTFDGGLITDGGSVRINLGYAYTDANDRRNMFNSTATSNYDLSAATSLQDPEESTGFYQTRHNFTLGANFKEQFFGDDLDTSLGISFIARSGRPYSLTFGGSGGFFDSASGFDNRLLYIPTGANDPNLSPSSNAAAVTSFLGYIEGLDCAKDARGRVIERNSCVNDWYYDMDLRFSQDLPGPLGNDKIKLSVVFDNFLNFLDKDWNVRRTRNFAGLVNVVTPPNGSPVDAQGRYIINSFAPDDSNDITTSASLWRLKFGVSYAF